MFDLIFGAKTLNDLSVKLNFKQQSITVDKIELPMRPILQMPTSKRKALALNNSLAKSKEPKRTKESFLTC